MSLGPKLVPGDEVLDLACGDGGLGEVLLERGLGYRGVDSTPEMVEAAQRRLGDRAPVELGDLNEYVPPARVAATTVFRAIYYAKDRRAFFGHVAAFTEKKLVFDLNPRQYRLDDVFGDLRAAGLPDDRACARSSCRRQLRSRVPQPRSREPSSPAARSRAWRSASASPTSSLQLRASRRRAAGSRR